MYFLAALLRICKLLGSVSSLYMHMQNHKTEKEFLNNYDKNAGNILKHIYFRVNNWDLAEDLTQETFFKTWGYIASGEKIKDLKTFAYLIAHNLIIDHYRRKSRAPLSIEIIDIERFSVEPLQEKQADQMIAKKIIKKHLEKMEEPYRQAIIHRYLDDLTIKEISKIIGKSENNISVIIHRAIKILKDKIYHEQKLC